MGKPNQSVEWWLERTQLSLSVPTKKCGYLEYNSSLSIAGGSKDSYVQYTLEAARNIGIRGMVFNPRGIADSPVLTPKIYSASYTGDLRWSPHCMVLNNIRCRRVGGQHFGGSGTTTAPPTPGVSGGALTAWCILTVGVVAWEVGGGGGQWQGRGAGGLATDLAGHCRARSRKGGWGLVSGE